MNLEGVTKKIEGTTILEDVTFSLRKNEIVGLIGRNGSGKPRFSVHSQDSTL